MTTTKSKVLKGGPMHMTLMGMIREDPRIVAYAVNDVREGTEWYTVFEFTFKDDESGKVRK